MDNNITIVVKKARQEEFIDKLRVFNTILLTGILLIKLSTLAQQVKVQTTEPDKE